MIVHILKSSYCGDPPTIVEIFLDEDKAYNKMHALRYTTDRKYHQYNVVTYKVTK